MTEELFMLTTYKSLVSKKNDNSKSFYMLAELIDNSIGSWDMNNMTSELEISLLLDMDKATIIASDNAFGMNKQELGDSVRLHTEKEGNVLNMFGVGMKNAAFWFAEDLIIKTKSLKSSRSYQTSIITSKIYNLSEPVTWKVIDSNKKTSGTEVIFDKVYSDKIIKPNVFHNEIIPIFQNKYKNYILNNRLKILITYIYKGKTKSIQLSPNNIKGQIIGEAEKQEFLHNVKSNIKNLKHIKNLKEIIEELVEKGEPLIFEHMTNFKGHTLNFVFGIQKQANKNDEDDEELDEKKNFRKNYGLMTFQKNRAINIPNVNQLEFGEYIRTHIKRVFGSVELGHVYKPDNNKREFNFGEDKEEFESLIKELGDDLLKLANSVAFTIGRKQKVKSNNSLHNQIKIQNELEAKTKNTQWEVKSNGTKATIVSEDGSKQVTIEIKEISVVDEDHPAYFINPVIENESLGEFTIEYNVNHPIWKPLTTSSMIDTKTVLYPLIVIMGISSLQISQKILTENMGVKYSSDFLNVMNIISNYTVK